MDPAKPRPSVVALPEVGSRSLLAVEQDRFALQPGEERKPLDELAADPRYQPHPWEPKL